MPAAPKSPNFGFLEAHDTLLVALGAQAEGYFAEDPSTCLIKLRQFGEVLAHRVAACAGIAASAENNQLELINRLRDAGVLAPPVRQLFHDLRRAGNAVAHEVKGSHADALHQLKMARELGIGFHRAFKDKILAKAFRGELVPQDPADEPASVLFNRIRAERESAREAEPTPRRKGRQPRVA